MKRHARNNSDLRAYTDLVADNTEAFAAELRERFRSGKSVSSAGYLSMFERDTSGCCARGCVVCKLLSPRRYRSRRYLAPKYRYVNPQNPLA